MRRPIRRHVAEADGYRHAGRSGLDQAISAVEGNRIKVLPIRLIAQVEQPPFTIAGCVMTARTSCSSASFIRGTGFDRRVEACTSFERS